MTAFLAVMAWGFGGVGYGPWRTARILRDTPDHADRILAVARAVQHDGALAAYGLLADSQRLRWLGPAFGTKYLAFCPPPSSDPPALIFDRLVAAWLRQRLGWRVTAVSWSRRVYERYVHEMIRWAEALEVTPEQLETCIFKEQAEATGGQWAGRSPGGPTRRRKGGTMTARREILDAAHALTTRGLSPFSPADVIAELRRRGSEYPESTLRTHIVSAMCVNAPPNHAVRYPDLYRVGRGQYVLYRSNQRPTP